LDSFSSNLQNIKISLQFGVKLIARMLSHNLRCKIVPEEPIIDNIDITAVGLYAFSDFLF